MQIGRSHPVVITVEYDSSNKKVYSDWTEQRKFDGVKHDALVLEHM